MIDKLSVFHGVNGQHAGTLEIRETRKSGASPMYEWAWHGGWAGSQNGAANWDDKASWGDDVVGLVLVPTMPFRALLLINKAWIGINRPPPRPWFKLNDTIELLDWNFGKNRPRPHVFKCKFMSTSA